MISALNLLQQLNGNNIRLLLLSGWIFLFASCSVFKPDGTVKEKPEVIEEVVVVPIDTVSIESPSSVKDKLLLKEVYNCALILPLFLDQFDIELSESENKDEFSVPSASLLALEFYEGVLISLDSLKEVGMNLNLYVFDSNNDTTKVRSFMEDKEFTSMDMVIGPVFNNCLKIAASHIKKQQIPLISPFSPSNSITSENANYIMCNPSLHMHCQEMVKYMVAHFEDKEIHIITQSSEYEKNVANKIISLLTAYDTSFKATEHSIIEAATTVKESTISHHLSLTSTNIIVIPSFNEPFVINLISQLFNLSEDYKIVVFGMPTWAFFESLRIDYIEKLELHLSNSFWINDASSFNNRFKNKYRDRFKTHPSEDAYKGYYTMLYFGLLLKKYGIGFKDHLSKVEAKDILRSMYSFKPIIDSSSAGTTINYYENGKINILKQEEFSLIKVND